MVVHKIHTFVEAQQGGSKIMNFFHQREMSTRSRAVKQDCSKDLNASRQVHDLQVENFLNGQID
jgi:hypothetical protein